MHSQSCCLRFLLNPFWWESDVKQGAWQPLQVPPCTTNSVGGVLSAHGRHKGLANLAHQVLVCKLCSTNNWIHRSWLVCLWKLSQVTSKVTHNWLIWGDWLILVWGVLGVTAICDLRLSTVAFWFRNILFNEMFCEFGNLSILWEVFDFTGESLRTFEMSCFCNSEPISFHQVTPGAFASAEQHFTFYTLKSLDQLCMDARK